MHPVTRAALTAASWPARGTARTARAINRWRTDQSNLHHYENALAAKAAKYQDLRAERDALIRRRTMILLVAALAAAVFTAWQTILGAVIAIPPLAAIPPDWATPLIPAFDYPGAKWHHPAPTWTWAIPAAIAAAVTAIGIPTPRTDTTAAIVKEETPDTGTSVTADAVMKAFITAIPAVKRALEADPKALTLIGPVQRDGPGWSVTVDLPLSMTTLDCIRAHENLASALRVAADQLYITPGRHAGQCRLWVSDVPPQKMPHVEWPHAHQKSLSLVEPVTIGATMKGTPVTLSLATQTGDGKTIAGGSMLVGGVSGSGKTTFMRLIVTAAALHPEATIAIFDGKGDNDYKALKPVCDWYRVGASPQHLTDLHTMLTQAQDEMAKRQKGRTDKNPLLIVIDEVQRVKNKDTQAVIEDILRIGRSSGIFVVLATQKPSAETLPTDLRDSVRTRACLRVPNQATNDMILGTGAYSEGRDATKFTRGMALVMDVDTDAVNMVRVANVTDDIAGRIAAAHAREPGQMFTDPRGEEEGTAEIEAAPALPELDPATEGEPEIVRLVRSVWPEGRDRASSAELAAALGWAGAGEVTRRLDAEAGISVRSVRIGGSTPKGLYWADLVGVMEESA